MNNDDLDGAIQRLRADVTRAQSAIWQMSPDGPHAADLRMVLDAFDATRGWAAALCAAWAKAAEAATDAEADAQRLAAKVRSVRLMFDAAGLHRTAEDMADVLDQHDALIAKRAAT